MIFPKPLIQPTSQQLQDSRPEVLVAVDLIHDLGNLLDHPVWKAFRVVLVLRCRLQHLFLGRLQHTVETLKVGEDQDDPTLFGLVVIASD